MSSTSDPSDKAVAVTPNDSTSLLVNGQAPRALYVGSTGNVNVELGDGGTVIFAGCPAGLILPVRVHKVYSSSTTASSIVAIY